MSITPDDLLIVATALAADGADECEQRASMSRSYYAAYHACKEWHDSLGAPGSNTGPAGGKHQVLINQLKNPTVGKAQALLSKKLGAKLEILRNRRVTADYKLAETLSPAEADTQLIQATEVVRQV